ncbi:GNAT family N-acetyltransferase [Sphingobacterium sp. InxBP1]|uniref:GNAT family N-acetyltransferase n=1 Tax=Sphingobacterium sp. InxBP1 TaxID=2870328 RepID=UPI002244B2F7|nr:GNAT family N-acetyltransferase [Sphingobacterium sp. InxBP1]MCW8313656.1 GNAT family N-acetyltransferase [Sphingobacterium sp. InxBP1]
MYLTIRPAEQNDPASVPSIMLQAMEDIVFRYIRQHNKEEAIRFLTQLFVESKNLYSYENTFVAVDDAGTVLGTLTGYNGDHFTQLRQPVLDLIQRLYENDLVPEAETTGHEYYIDSIAVSPLARGKGIGTELLTHAINYAQRSGYEQVGLLVDLKNPSAQKLYERLGFKPGHKTYLMGAAYYHMHISLL